MQLEVASRCTRCSSATGLLRRFVACGTQSAWSPSGSGIPQWRADDAVVWTLHLCPSCVFSGQFDFYENLRTARRKQAWLLFWIGICGVGLLLLNMVKESTFIALLGGLGVIALIGSPFMALESAGARRKLKALRSQDAATAVLGKAEVEKGFEGEARRLFAQPGPFVGPRPTVFRRELHNFHESGFDVLAVDESLEEVKLLAAPKYNHQWSELYKRTEDAFAADPIAFAARRLDLSLIQQLGKIDIPTASHRSDRPLCLALIGADEVHGVAEATVVQIIQELLGGGDDVGCASAAGWTALHSAAYLGYCDVARFLAQQGAKVNAVAEAGATPLMAAICSKRILLVDDRVRIVDCLLSLGADSDMRNAEGRTAFDLVKDLPGVERLQATLSVKDQWRSADPV